MVRLPGILKVTAVLALDFVIMSALFDDDSVGVLIIGMVALYVWWGGYFSLLKESAVRSKRLPAYEAHCLEAVKAQLAKDVKSVSAADISKLKLYLIPGDDSLNATAYGTNCVSVTQSLFNNVDPITLEAVLGHEISHILNRDAEFNRAALASITLLVGAWGPSVPCPLPSWP